MVSLAYLPLVLAVALAALLVVTPFVRSLDRTASYFALQLFGGYVRQQTDAMSSTRARRTGYLRAARRGATYRMYASKTLLYAGATALVGSVVGSYAAVEFVRLLGVPAAKLRAAFPGPLAFLAAPLAAPTLSPTQSFVVLLTSSATVGVVAGLGTYFGRWWYPRRQAETRERQIDASLERTVAFLYALSRSGMSFPEVLRIVTDNKDVYGEAAREFEVAVREMDLFGADIHTALQHLSERTPSDEFAEFCDNLGGVLRSGRDLSRFLDDQHEQYRTEARSKQSQFLDLLGTLAEAYVTALVAGPLFLLTILVIVGLLVGGTKLVVALMVYALIPLATGGFLVYLDSLSVTGAVEPDPATPDDEHFGGFGDIRATETDGGTATGRAADAARFRFYRRFRWLFEWLSDPVRKVMEEPASVLAFAVPVAAVYALVRTYPYLAAGAVPPGSLLDDVLVHCGLFVGGTFAVAYEARQRQIRAIERSVPDFLDRLASVNEAGMPISQSLGQLLRGDVGSLDAELRRTWTDIYWGSRVETALQRFDARVRSVAITRAVTLITNALRASGNIGPVLRIAAEEAKAARRLTRERRQEMMTYVVVIYVSFFVFLAIVVALNVYFLPNVPTIDDFGGQIPGGFGNIGGLTKGEKGAYETLIFHALIVQGACSGVVAGEMGASTVRAGAKHATAMVLVAYVTFLVLG